jgi:hypothetical protein
MRTVVELESFIDLVEGRLLDDERFELVSFLALNPTAGDLIPGAGGARKLRWATSGRGKSGGARVITYYHCEGCPIFLLSIYLKSERENLSRAEINAFKVVCKELAHEHT